jgi:hypothetical protein
MAVNSGSARSAVWGSVRSADTTALSVIWVPFRAAEQPLASEKARSEKQEAR